MGYPDNGGTSGQNGFDAHECSPPALQESRAPSRKGVHCRKCWATLHAVYSACSCRSRRRTRSGMHF